MKGVIGLTVLLTVSVYADMEHVAHGVHSAAQGEHFQNGQHNPEFDHDAILGSVEKNREFENLHPDEAKRRLRVILDKMDANEDGLISKEEISNWVVSSFKALNEEEAEGKLDQMDSDHDKLLTWAEYLSATYGYSPDQLLDQEEDKNPEIQAFMKIVIDDRTKFQLADVDKDGKLSVAEFTALLHPYNYDHMKEFEVMNAIHLHDKNGDGLIEFHEYLGESTPSREDEIVEREQFMFYDKNGDLKMDKQEVRQWVLPDDRGLADDEAEHLFSESDINLDGKLMKDEILERYDLWVGSAATNYGEQVHEEL